MNGRWVGVGIAAGLGLMGSAGCSDAPEARGKQPTGGPSTALSSEVGFVRLDAEAYELGDATLESGGASLFYNFQPAQRTPETSPLIVVTGGGPGAATLLLAAATAPVGVIDASAAGIEVGPRAGAWSDLGHLLFIDARNTGYSPVHTALPADPEVRVAGFGAGDYNVYRDAADVLWVLAHFIRSHPALAERPLYLAAESYGGARTAALVDLIRGEAAGAERVPALRSSMLSGLLEEPLTGAPGGTVGAALAARLRGQILLQPIIAGALQDEVAGELFEAPGSIFDQLAAEVGVPYVRCDARPQPCQPFGNAHTWLQGVGRSRYDFRAPSSWLDEHLAAGAAVGGDAAAAAAVMGVTPAALAAVLASRESGAYRYREEHGAERGTLAADLGPLHPWDAYFTPLNSDVFQAFHQAEVIALEAHPDGEALAGLFAENLRHVETFITRAENDLHVYAPALAGVIERIPGVTAVTAVGDDVLEVTLDDGAVRRIASPPIAESSHAVASDQPVELHDALAAWLEVTGGESP